MENMLSLTEITNALKKLDRGESKGIQEEEVAIAGLETTCHPPEKVARRRDRLSTLEAEIGIAIASSTTLSEILNRCTTAMLQHLDATFVGIWIFNRSTRLLELQAFAGEQSPATEFYDRIPFGISLIGFVAQHRQPYITPSQKHETLAGYPLIVEERLLGVVLVACRTNITEEMRNLLGWVANAIAIAIDRSRSWASRESLLFRLANQIRNSLELNQILETAVQEIHTLLQLDWCLFMWYRPEEIKDKIQEQISSNTSNFSANIKTQNSSWEVVKEVRNPSLPSLIGRYPAEKVGTFSEKLLNLEIIRIDDVATLEEPVMRRFLMSWGYAAILTLPIQTHSGEIGAFSCGMCNTLKGSFDTRSELPHNVKLRPWSDSEVELLRAVADQLAIAIDQAELYTQARNSAEIAQTQAQQIAETLHKLQATQTQLIQTEKMSSLGNMVAGVAHEINNPINFISGNITHATNYVKNLLDLLELYQKHSPNPHPEIQEKAESIELDFIKLDLPKLIASMKIGTDRISQIVLSLRNFSRLEESEKKIVDIHEGIDSTLLILQHRLKSSCGKFAIEIVKEYGELPLVECCAGQLNQVFMNILSNAIDALENHPPPRIITIETAVGEQECNFSTPDVKFVVIRISDNGPGMTEAIVNRSFDPFFTTKPVGKGTGLGLSISHHIVVEKHGGILKCFSKPGEGAEFLIQIPLT
ncbi:histidine kinase [Oscillatoriales cyanobacterium USR001]|nr:histidine kinase [Oscillatoriales cyanobacterium USR001]